MNELLANFLGILINVLTLAIFGRVIMSWVTMFAPTSPAVQAINQLLYQITEPVLGPLRRVIPPLGQIDLTPMIAVIVLRVVGPLIVRTLLTA